MRRNVIETVLGAVVLIVALVFLTFVYKSAKVKTTDGYIVHAFFTNTGALQSGADVKISGVKIGSVSKLTLDPKSFHADVAIMLQPDIKLPDDSSAGIASAGLMGDSFVNLIPGGSDKNLSEGGTIQMTQPSVDLVDMLGKFIFSVADSKEKAKPAEAAPAATAPVTAPAPEAPNVPAAP